jgi:hypothetical protein
MEEIRYKTNELYCEDVALSDIAAAHGTPAYVYSRKSIVDHSRWIERAFSDLFKRIMAGDPTLERIIKAPKSMQPTVEEIPVVRHRRARQA